MARQQFHRIAFPSSCVFRLEAASFTRWFFIIWFSMVLHIKVFVSFSKCTKNTRKLYKFIPSKTYRIYIFFSFILCL